MTVRTNDIIATRLSTISQSLRADAIFKQRMIYTMREFIINDGTANRRLDKFMSDAMPNVKQGEIYKALRKKKVRVNGKHKDGSYRTVSGDIIHMYISDEFFDNTQPDYEWIGLDGEISIVYEDENIIITNKPSGMPSQDTNEIHDSLESRIRSYLYRKGEVNLNDSPVFIPSLCHRIDRNTSGLVIAAKNPASLKTINEKIKSREIRKFYLCETEKTPTPPSGIIKGYLKKSEASQKMMFSNSNVPNSVYCETLYHTLKQGSPALVEAELLTGRTHQIRASFSHIGCPLCGDVKYGAKAKNTRGYQHLKSYKIIFDFATDGGILDYLSGKTIEIR